MEGVIPDLIKRAVERGVERASEAPESLKQLVGDRKLPKEIAAFLHQQVDDTKSGLLRVFANEVQSFLEHANLAVEMQKILTTVQFEINTTIRFKPNDGQNSAADKSAVRKPEVKTQVFMRREESRARRRGRHE